MGEYLAESGLDVWLYEWSNHGLSSDPGLPLSADFHALHEVPAVVEEVKRRTGSDQVFWVAHSGGGFLPHMYLARSPDSAGDFRGIVALGSQTTAAGDTLLGRLRILILALGCHLFGNAPGHRVGLGPEPESKGFMLQWARWNWSKNWAGLDRWDYHEGLRQVSVPMLAIAGGNDWVAPSRGCRALYESIAHPASQFVLAGKEQGFSEDYNHSRLALSRSAQREIWPLVLRWMQQL